MAIYKYKCQSCGLEIERIEDFDSEGPECPEDVDCPENGAGTLERQIGNPAVHFKGDGFYVNEEDDAENPASNDR